MKKITILAQLTFFCFGISHATLSHANYHDERDQIINQFFTKNTALKNHCAHGGFRTRADIAQSAFSSVPKQFLNAHILIGQSLSWVNADLISNPNITAPYGVSASLETNPKDGSVNSTIIQIEGLSVNGQATASDVVPSYLEQYDLFMSSTLYGLHDLIEVRNHAKAPKVAFIVTANLSNSSPRNIALRQAGFIQGKTEPYWECALGGNPIQAIVGAVLCIPEYVRRNNNFFGNIN